MCIPTPSVRDVRYWHRAWYTRAARYLPSSVLFRGLFVRRTAKSDKSNTTIPGISVLRAGSLCHVRPTQCPVLPYRAPLYDATVSISLCPFFAVPGTEPEYRAISLRACYGIPGTDRAYAATSEYGENSPPPAQAPEGGSGSILLIVLYTCYAMSGTDLWHPPTTRRPAREYCVLRRYNPLVSCYAHATGCPASLRTSFALPGTDVALPAYARPTGCPVLTERLRQERRHSVAAGMVLRARYAIPGTDVAYGSMALRACYAIPGTNWAYGAIVLRAYYAISGTDIAYGAMALRARAMRCPVLT
eukprot:2915776-Rhodomonas_salina.1